ncbi:alanine--tRNA ligase [Candidatus Uhrbacteria bacterium]|jgi:alanyl-tRNA synthetase|nr:alanine--tRNA ligase [Candidatus Uhrbacteria bacterium]MBT7717400.1 alanine--tRNA ligase [Candidatus Uhrbacteria bacterium]
MKANELRQKYIEFFVSHGHKQIPSASLIPENDPSVLFNTAGMQPLVPYLMGEEHPQGDKLVNYQKCVRTGDIDEVGDNTHLTFFEMLGNWSLGNYFKKESIEMSWEFLTADEWLGIDKGRLAVSVFAGDDTSEFDQESFDKWIELGVSESRIAKLGKEDNWWPAGGKNVGPQGPDAEIFYWTGESDAPEKFDAQDDQWVEIWNNVFMEFYRDKDGNVAELEKKNVDTGMGLERTVAVLQGKKSVYETEIFTGILNKIEELSNKKYEFVAGELGLDEKPACWEEDACSMTIIADHVRSAVMIMSDGVVPSNKDQGYVLRRLIRRAVRFGKKIGIEDAFTDEVAEVFIDEYKNIYVELGQKHNSIIDELRKEEEKFGKTLEKGERTFNKIFEKKGKIEGEDAFLLYTTYGFPLELTEEMAQEKGQDIDRKVFECEFIKHKDLSRAGSEQKFKGGLAEDSDETKKLHTATHLMHQALRNVLGDHVEQRGSNITAERLRFDFSHSEKVTIEQREEVERIVNEQVEKALPITCESMSVDEAQKLGAIGIFGDKYKGLDSVKVYTVGNDEVGVFSREICGGPHAQNTQELGKFKIKKEEASSAGIRRIKAVLLNE